MTQMPHPGAILTQKQALCKKYSWKRALTPVKISGIYSTSNYLYFMIIYLCIKYESNTLIFSKGIKWKQFFEVENGP